MASKMEIWNMALSHIGHRGYIRDPNESSVEASHCRTFYPTAVEVALERHAWTFATKREQLAQITNPVQHWLYAYSRPNACVKMRAVLLYQSTDDSQEQDFEEESTPTGEPIIYTNVENAVAKFTALVSDTAKFSPMFTLSVSYDLAAMLAGPIPKDIRMKDAMTKQAAYFASLAAASDANRSKSSTYNDFIPSSLAARR